jgi:hypothetical protein
MITIFWLHQKIANNNNNNKIKITSVGANAEIINQSFCNHDLKFLKSCGMMLSPSIMITLRQSL